MSRANPNPAPGGLAGVSGCEYRRFALVMDISKTAGFDLKAIVVPFINICFLRLGPQDLPGSKFLFRLTLAGFFVAVTLSGLFVVEPVQAPALGLVATVLLVVLVHLALRTNKFPERVRQTITAMAGTGVFFHLLITPIQVLMNPSSQSNPPPELATLAISVFVWNLAVEGHILRHALSAPYIVGLTLAIAFTMVGRVVVGTLFP